MAKKSMESLTETMFYVLMALKQQEACGIDIAAYIDTKTGGRIKMGPGTLYTILSRFVECGYILETQVEGRKRTYRITSDGAQAYDGELNRLRRCLADAESGGNQ